MLKRVMQDTREIKKTAFLELRDLGHTFDEIKKILNISLRTLYYWQNEHEDIEPVVVPSEDTALKEKIENLEDRVESLTGQLKNLRRQKADEKTKEQLETEKQIEKHFLEQRARNRIKDQKRQKKIRQIQKNHEISKKNAAAREWLLTEKLPPHLQ